MKYDYHEIIFQNHKNRDGYWLGQAISGYRFDVHGCMSFLSVTFVPYVALYKTYQYENYVAQSFFNWGAALFASIYVTDRRFCQCFMFQYHMLLALKLNVYMSSYQNGQ